MDYSMDIFMDRSYVNLSCRGGLLIHTIQLHTVAQSTAHVVYTAMSHVSKSPSRPDRNFPLWSSLCVHRATLGSQPCDV